MTTFSVMESLTEIFVNLGIPSLERAVIDPESLTNIALLAELPGRCDIAVVDPETLTNKALLAQLPGRCDIGHWSDHLPLGNHTPPPRLDEFPLELLFMILQYTDAETLGNFRLTCRRIARDTQSLLCKEVTFTETPSSFSWLQSICDDGSEDIRDACKSLVYLPFAFQEIVMTKDKWDRRILFEQKHRSDYDGPSASFDEMQELKRNRRSMARSSENIHILARAMKALKPKSIEILLHSCQWNKDGFALGSHKSTIPAHKEFRKLYDQMPPIIRYCDAHSLFNYSPNNPLGNVVATRSFMAVLLAMEQNYRQGFREYKLQELKAATGLIVLMRPDIGRLAKALKGLSKLELQLIGGPYCEFDHERLGLSVSWDLPSNRNGHLHDLSTLLYDDAHPDRWTLGKFLSHATALKELTLLFTCTVPRTVSALNNAPQRNHIRELALNSFTLPKLESLTLAEMEFTGQDLLLPILAHAKTLKKLGIDNPKLLQPVFDDWAWPRLIRKLRTLITNGELSLDEIKFSGRFAIQMGRRSLEANMQSCRGLNGVESKSRGELVADFVLGDISECLWCVRHTRIMIGIDTEDFARRGCELPDDWFLIFELN